MADYKKVKIVDSNGNLLDEVNVKDEVARNGLDGKVNKAGDTMRGDLTMERSTDPSIYFKQRNDSMGYIFLRDNQFHFNEVPADQQSYREAYSLPKPDSGLTVTKWYDILTSKNPVTVAQGGTGGTDSGWMSLTNASVFTGNIFYRKVGIFVEIISSKLRLVEALTGESIELGYLPNGYRSPKDSHCFAGHSQVAGGGIGMISITTNGKITFFKPSTISRWETYSYINFSSMFII